MREASKITAEGIQYFTNKFACKPRGRGMLDFCGWVGKLARLVL